MTHVSVSILCVKNESRLATYRQKCGDMLRTFSFYATDRVELGRPEAFDRALKLAPDFNRPCGHSDKEMT